MSIGAGTKLLSEISSNILFYYSANDITVPVGSDVTSIISRVGTHSCNFFGNVNYGKLQVDAQGFNYITYNVGGNIGYFSGSNLYTPNNNETFVYVLDNVPNTGYHFGFDSAPNFTQIYYSGCSYANYSVGSSRITYTNIGSTKTIISVRFSASKMELFNRTKSVGTIINPATYSAFNGAAYKVFNAENGGRHYAIINIKEYLPDDKMMQLIKLLAFEHGVKI